MSTDSSIHHAFRGLDLNDPQHDPRKQQHQHTQPYTTPPRQSTTGSLRSPTILTSDLPGQPGYTNNAQSPGSLGQSAAARFERFFPSSPNTHSAPSSAGQTFTSSVGSAAGLAANKIGRAHV